MSNLYIYLLQQLKCVKRFVRIVEFRVYVLVHLPSMLNHFRYDARLYVESKYIYIFIEL